MPLPRAPRRVEYQNLFKCQARSRCSWSCQVAMRWEARREVGWSAMEIDNLATDDPHLWCLEARGEQRSSWTPTLPLPAAFAFFFPDSPSALFQPSPAFIGKMSYEFCCSNLKAVIKTNFICFSFRTPPTGDPSYLLSLPAQLPLRHPRLLFMLLLLLRLLFNTGQQIKSYFANKCWS